MEGTVGHLVMASGPGFRNGRQLCVRIDMACASAVLQFADVVDQPVDGLLVTFRLEGTRVAAAASGAIGRELPGRLVGVGGVTGSARGGTTMIAGKLTRGVG